MKQYRYKGRIYSIVNCKVEDIPSHVERVSSYWPVEMLEDQIDSLKDCIENGTAIQLVSDKGKPQAVIYCLPIKEQELKSHLLWTRSKKLLAILAWHLRTHLDISKIYFMPHSKDFIPFEFMVTPQSIRRFHSHNMPLVIDLFSPTNRELGYALIREGVVQEV